MLDCTYRVCFSQVVFLIFDSFSVMNNTLSEHQIYLLRVFKAFDAFCSKNGIPYFACYGTLIGAIRHGGFIPWDDDLDVVMKREDYDRFINLRNQVGEGYRIASFQDGESPYPFAKFFSTEGTVWEYPQFSYIIGPWVDVFPLDKCQNGNKDIKALEQFHRAMWKYRKAVAYSPWSEICRDLLHGRLKAFSIKMAKKIRYSPFKKCYIKQAMKAEDNLRSLTGNGYGDYSIPLVNEVFPLAWFSKAKRVPFEDATILVPEDYDEVLSFMYGDYMKLPPEEKRKGHGFYFINLKQRLSKEEILSQYGNTLAEEPPLSIHTIIDELKHRSKGWKSVR